jgi:lipopolysaccharide export system ATP-binding protein
LTFKNTNFAGMGESMILRTENLVKKYRNRTVVNNVSVEVKQGEIVGLLGPNGAGKTTSFYMIVGLIKPLSGKVFLEDREITDLPMYKRAQLGIGYLAQEASVFRSLSVEDNIKAVLEFTNLSKSDQKERLESLLSEFGLSHVRKSMGIQLSGGERRRTEIARALAVDPKFILLDEPFAGVDPIAVEDIQNIVSRLRDKNIGILITDHNVHETLTITDRAYLLFEGSVLKSGSAEELAADEQVRNVYLGKNFELRK